MLEAFEVLISENKLDSPVFTSNNELVSARLAGKVFVFCGPPGSGKGSRCSMIAGRYGIVHISTGDLFREEVKNETEIGKIIGPIMESGAFVPAEYANKIIEARLSQSDIQEKGVLLDGFPRSLDHLRDLDTILKNLGKDISAAIHLEINEDVAVERILKRIVKDSSGTVVKRADDEEGVIHKRFKLYMENIDPLLQEFMRRDLLFKFPSSSVSIDAHAAKIVEVLCYPERFSTKPTACSLLALHLSDPITIVGQQLIRDFRDRALKENEAKRTGAMRRFVYLSTQNKDKFDEFLRIFDRYGVEVLHVPPLSQIPAHVQSDELICALLREKTKDLVPIAVLVEESVLLKPGTALRSSMRHGCHVDHKSTLTAWTFTSLSADTGGAPQLGKKEYVHVTQGRIREIVSNEIHTSPVFGWDAEFELLSTGKTYQHHKEQGLKISSRDMVISAFLEDRIYYKQLKRLQHHDILVKRPVDLDVDLLDFVKGEPLYNSEIAREVGLCNLLTHVLNEGIFFKAADTRLEANYWQPGLNAGLPLIAKKDPIHELTFMFHDFGHFLMKDLIFTGTDTPIHRGVYIVSRMISEAITIMTADGLFVDTLRRGGLEYDFSTRCIYPLFQDCGLDFGVKGVDFISNLRKIVKASVDYTVKGDDSSFRALLSANGKSDDNLIKYQHKFKPFFVSDLQWTVHNYENMAQRAEEMRRWWSITAPIRAQLDLPLETIDDFLSYMDLEELDASALQGDRAYMSQLVDSVFDVMFRRRIAPVFQLAMGGLDGTAPPVELQILPQQQRARRGLLRYMIGQAGVFARFDAVPESRTYLARIVEEVEADQTAAAIRATYEEYLAILAAKNIISTDDLHNFKEVYPLFEPFYVTYDKNEEYDDIAPLALRVLRPKAQRDFQLQSVQKFMCRPLTSGEKRFHDTMATLIESAGGQIDEGIFVVSPGVALLASTLPRGSTVALTGADPAMLHASFLIAGIAIETSLELIAHKEAAVARLTSSKTQAMSVPLLRVQGGNARSMMAYFGAVQRTRTAMELSHDPKKTWENGVELFNMTHSGCKATAMVYTMAIADFHKLFIGRMGEAGNELEVREVVRIMATALHAIYPSFILTADQYLGLANGEKYKAEPPSTISGSNITLGVAHIVAETQLTSAARAVFTAANIDVAQPEAHQLAEFCSRITYLAFSKERASAGPYIQKMIREFQHLSIVGACRVTAVVANVSRDVARDVGALAAQLGGAACAVHHEGSDDARAESLLVNASLKAYLKMFREMSSSEALRELGRQLATALHEAYPFVVDAAEEYTL